MATRWIIAGNKGQLGCALTRALATPGREIVAAFDLPEVDIADPAAVASEFERIGGAPDFVVNAAAFTHVDRCESERDAAHRANALGPKVLAAACAAAGSRLAHVSTDYVFRGDGSEPYREDDAPDPVSAYGATKLEGEGYVLGAAPDSLVVRTSWVFGEGRNFLGAIVGQAAARRDGSAEGPLRVVDDQRGRPTYAEDLAGAIIGLLEQDRRGLYHVANAGVATWWDLARVTLDRAGFSDVVVDRIRSSELDSPAPRPFWSVLDCSKAEACGVGLRSWQEAVGEYLESDLSPIAAQGASR
jgi:dTDP-4-dehydrorhamnose reductase